MKPEYQTKEIARCDCGCHALHLWHEPEFPDQYYLEFWFRGLTGKYTSIRDRLRALWYLLRGYPYMFDDIIIQREDLRAFAKKVLEETEEPKGEPK